jgi:hypothetical protein
MIFGNTRVDVLRTDEANPPVNGFGDPVDSDTVALAGLPADIQRATIRRQDPTSGRTLTVTGFEVQVRRTPGFTFQPTDRLKDKQTGDVLQVETIDEVRTPAGRKTLLMCTQVA